MTDLDTARAEAFAGKMIGVLNGGTLALMTSIGHRTELFDTMAGLPAATSAEIAAAAGLDERYVREWLGAMVTGGIVEYEPERRAYTLPPEHAGSLTRAAGPDNLAMITQYISLLGEVEGQIVECFRKGGGVPYSAFPRFQMLQGEESRMVHDGGLVSRVLPLVPGLVERLTAGIDVLDVGCGHGHALNLMAREFPASRFTGLDFSAEAIVAGRREAAEWGLANSTFHARDVSTFDAEGAYDFVTAFDSIHDQAWPRRVLKGIERALRDDGTFLMVDIRASSELHENLSHPLAPSLYTFSTTHCMTVSLALGGEGLGTVWGEQKARELLAEAGFTRVSVETVPTDFLNNYYVARR